MEAGGNWWGTSPPDPGFFIARAIDKGVAKVHWLFDKTCSKKVYSTSQSYMEMPGKEGLVKIPGLLPVLMLVFHVGLGK